MKRITTPLRDRIAAHCVPDGDCIVWTRSRNQHGYGQIVIQKKKYVVHRLVYELEHGPIPNGLQVLHSCDNPSCVRLEHLSLGTHQDNMNDKVARNRQSAARSLESAVQSKSLTSNGTKITLSVTLTVEQFDWLNRICDAESVTRSVIARRLFQAAMDAEKREEAA